MFGVLIALAINVALCAGGYDCISNCACRMENSLLIADCSSKNFTEVPVPRQFQVHVLLLSFNKLIRLRKNAFAAYTSLLQVDLSGNQLRFIETGAFQPLQRSKLQFLDLSHNSLRKIPSSDFRSLSKSLKNLSLSFNAFQHFPSELREMSNLDDFDISHNTFIASIEDDAIPPSLKSLNVDHTAIRKYNAKVFRNVTSLQRLILSNNIASSVLTFGEGVFDRLTNLRILDLSGSYCRELSPNSFRHLPNLTSLSLRSSRVRVMPTLRCVVDSEASSGEDTLLQNSSLPADFQLGDNETTTSVAATGEPDPPLYYEWCNPDLQELDLSHNRITSISANNEDLMFPPSLVALDLSYTIVPSVRREIFSNLKKLRSLSLSYSRVGEIARDVFFDLDNLQSIGLSGNRFHNLPRLPPQIKEVRMSHTKVNALSQDSVGTAERLLEADWSAGLIERIDSFVFSNATSLRSLNLSRNAVKHIARNTLTIGPATSSSALQVLDLSSNKISVIHSHAFESHRNLCILLLQNNQIEEIGDLTFFGLLNVKVLQLDDNQILDIAPSALKNLVMLEKLTLENNELEIIYPLLLPSSLKHVTAFRNSLLEIHEQFLPNVVTFSARENNLTTFPLLNASRLSSLDVSDNQISMLSMKDLSGIPQLHKLDARFNENLNEVNFSIFRSTPHLEELNLAGCALQMFVGDFLPSLKVLTLKDNEIGQLNEPLERHLPALEELDLSFNNLTSVNAYVFSSSETLRTLDLNGNSFHCDCRLETLVEWISNCTAHHTVDVEVAESYTCESPAEAYGQPLLTEVENLHCVPPTQPPKPHSANYLAAVVLIPVAALLLLVGLVAACLFQRNRSSRLMSSSSTSSSLGDDAFAPSTLSCCTGLFSCLHEEGIQRPRLIFSDDESRDLMTATPLQTPTEQDDHFAL